MPGIFQVSEKRRSADLDPVEKRFPGEYSSGKIGYSLDCCVKEAPSAVECRDRDRSKNLTRLPKLGSAKYGIPFYPHGLEIGLLAELCSFKLHVSLYLSTIEAELLSCKAREQDIPIATHRRKERSASKFRSRENRITQKTRSRKIHATLEICIPKREVPVEL